MLENLPAITLSELKKGDAVVVTGTAGTDTTRVTAATLITGDAEIIQRLQRFQRGVDRPDGMSPGLPGGVIGGGTGDRDRP
jgi:thiamine monophosphate kinase